MNTIKKQTPVNKLPAAPASFSVSAIISGVVAEPGDAGFERLTQGLCFLQNEMCVGCHAEVLEV